MSRDLRWFFLLVALAATALNLAADQAPVAIISATCAGYWICSLLYRP